MTQYRKRPVVIDAVRWDGTDHGTYNVMKFCASDDVCHVVGPGEEQSIEIATLEGRMTASVGDWIIRGVKGELYPCKPDIFEATYEFADTDPHPAPDALVKAVEDMREQCASIADDMRVKHGSPVGDAYSNGVWDQGVRIAGLIRALPVQSLTPVPDAAVADAVKAEREACAATVDKAERAAQKLETEWSNKGRAEVADMFSQEALALNRAAAAIRARSTEG